MRYAILLLHVCLVLVVSKSAIGPFREVSTETVDNLKKTTYLSFPLPLKPGWCIQSDPLDTAMPMPSQGWIRGFFAEVVDANNNSVPLSEVYLHHWVFLNSNGNAGPCASLGFAVGVGAETRGTPILFPPGYGVRLTPDENWFASIHVLRTTYVENVKHCIECHCPGGPEQGGGIQCCPTTQEFNVSCATVQNAPDDTKTYFLKYTVTWEPIDTTPMTPITLIELDVTKCSFQYNVRQCADPNGECVDKQENSYVSDMEGDIVFLYGHMHIGGINVTFTINDEVVYNALPTYGTGSKPGNEKGYLVGISTLTPQPPIHLKKGDKLGVSAHYHNDVYHDGVMGLLLVGLAETNSVLDS